MMKASIQGNLVVLESGKTITFESDVKEVAVVDEVTIVLLKVPQGRTLTENVFGIVGDGERVWQIERIIETAKDPVNYYTGILSCGTGMVRLANWNDVSVEVDILSGKVIGKREGRFT